MEGTNTSRKSCDLCYRRKLKCDGQKPRCSQCRTYSIDCTYIAPSRRSATKKRRSPENVEDNVGINESRYERLETLIQNVAKRLEIVEQGNGVESPPQFEERSTITTVMPVVVASEDNGVPPITMLLPPLDQILPTIEAYLQNDNSVLPLFQADTLLQLIYDWYRASPSQRDPMAWAAINVVLALSQRKNLVASHEAPSSTTCLRNAESVLSRVVLGEIKLLNVQVLIGMVLLLQSSSDLKPALVLIATTIRLAHAIGLHDRSYSTHLGPRHSRERACVFWMAYILDKDLSMRSKQPSIQADDDINLDLPWPTVPRGHETSSGTYDVSEHLGIIASSDGTIEFSFFIARIQLAVVEGGVYDYIYSTRSHKRDSAERSRALQSVAAALEQWKASIPSEFNASACSKRVAPGMLRFLTALYSTSLACTTLINQAHAWDAEWISSLRRYSTQGAEPLLPPKWESLVSEARDLLTLIGVSGGIDRWNVWESGCSYMTAMVILTANSLRKPNHKNLSLDSHVVDVGLQTIEKLAEETRSDNFQSFVTTCSELHQRVRDRCGDTDEISNTDDY